MAVQIQSHTWLKMQQIRLEEFQVLVTLKTYVHLLLVYNLKLLDGAGILQTHPMKLIMEMARQLLNGDPIGGAMRKIPDDPGRLLRNKMEREFQRRGKQNFTNEQYW